MNKKEMQKQEAYEAPQVEVIEVEVEKGFSASGDISPYREGNGWS